MSENEVARIAERCKILYPEMFTGQDIEKVISVWHSFMREERFGAVLDRLDNYARENRFAPKMSDLVRPKSKYEVLK